MRPQSVPILLLVAGSLWLVRPAWPTTLTVRQDGMGDHTNLFDAVFASSPDDTVLVWPGLYQDPPIVVTHSLTILSTEGRDSTTIRGRSQYLSV